MRTRPHALTSNAPGCTVPQAGALTDGSADDGGAAATGPTLLSRRTPAWDRLLSEGLFHPNSGYPRVEPTQEADRAELQFWEERVTHEFRDGAPHARVLRQAFRVR